MIRRTVRRMGTFVTLVALLVPSIFPVSVARGCPFCSAISSTFSEDIASMDAVFIGRLAKPLAHVGGAAAELNVDQSIHSSIATFSVDEILKGKELLGNSKTVLTPYSGEAQQGDLFLVMGSDPKNLSWSPPFPLNARQHAYLSKIVELPPEGPERLAFFFDYLDDPDPTLEQDAYDEFARAAYDVIKQLKPKMDRDQLVKWINAPEATTADLRLYLTMLGVCGSQEDLPMLEKRLRRSDNQAKQGLDALIACYVTLRGSEGIDLVEELFLKKVDGNFSDEFADVYAAIMALRFHGEQGGGVPRERILQAFYHLLDNPQMADLIIPDLARWEDWSQLDRMAKLFRHADTASTNLRMYIINYARACPLPAAKELLAEFEKIDPATFKRTMTFFPTLRNDDQ